jgi:hypothetical protein
MIPVSEIRLGEKARPTGAQEEASVMEEVALDQSTICRGAIATSSSMLWQKSVNASSVNFAVGLPDCIAPEISSAAKPVFTGIFVPQF